MSEAELLGYISGLAMASCGFQVAPNSNLPVLLPQITPNGGTAFRDSLMEGINLMIKLNQALKQLKTNKVWNFAHVILTDGLDEHSKTSFEDAIKVMYMLGKMIDVGTLRIIFLGVNVCEKGAIELAALAYAGGQNAQYYNVKNADIQKIFAKIRINLGIEKKRTLIGVSSGNNTALLLHQQNQLNVTFQQQNYAILFNLDMSGSMQGEKWKNVCHSVDKFIGHLGPRDIVAGIVFNHQSVLLTNPNQKNNNQTNQNPRKPQPQIQYPQNSSVLSEPLGEAYGGNQQDYSELEEEKEIPEQKVNPEKNQKAESKQNEKASTTASSSAYSTENIIKPRIFTNNNVPISASADQTDEKCQVVCKCEIM